MQPFVAQFSHYDSSIGFHPKRESPQKNDIAYFELLTFPLNSNTNAIPYDNVTIKPVAIHFYCLSKLPV